MAIVLLPDNSALMKVTLGCEKNLNYNLTKSKRANRGRIAFYPNLEKQIIEWINDGRSQGIALNTMLDAFRCHRKPSLLQYVHRQHKTEIAIIPGGMTSILQPLDVGINRPMKSMLKAKWGSGCKTGTRLTQSLDANVPRIWSPSLNGSSTAGKHLINRSSLNHSKDAAYQMRWTEPRTTSFGMKKQHAKKRRHSPTMTTFSSMMKTSCRQNRYNNFSWSPTMKIF